MSRMSITLVDVTTNQQLATLSRRVRNLQVAESTISFDVAMPDSEAIQFANLLTATDIVASRYGIRSRYRLQRPTLIADGVAFVGCGLVAALDDDEYCALWSSTSVAEFELVTTLQIANRVERWQNDTNNRLYLAPRKGDGYGTGSLGSLSRAIPHLSSRQLRGIQFTYTMTAQNANWVGQVERMQNDYTSQGVIWRLASAAGTLIGTRTIIFSGSERITMNMWYNAGGLTNYAGETGDTSLSLTNIRLITSTEGLINTTLGTAVAGPGVAVITPASMQNIAVGTKLTIGVFNAMEEVTVSAITATTFTATFAAAHAGTDSVWGFVGLFADEIVKDVLTQNRTLNSTQLSAATALIQKPTLDITDAAWINAKPLDVLKDCAAPIKYDYGVDSGGRLFFYPRGTYRRDWLVRAGDVQLARPIDTVRNSVRAAYQDANNLLQQTAYATDAVSPIVNRLTRRQTVAASTTSATTATTIRDTALNDTADRNVESRISFKRLFDRTGGEYPPDSIKPGDTITIGNLPALVAGTLVRTFTVAETGYDPVTNTPTVTPAAPLPGLDVLLAWLATR